MTNGNCIQDAFMCCYYGYDCHEYACCLISNCDCCCWRQACCLACNVNSRGCCCVGDPDAGECCKLGCCCCDFGCVWPKTCCASVCQMCCCYHVASLPCSEYYMDECTCAFCFFMCCPTCGCCNAPPDCPALRDLRTGDHKKMTE